MTLPRCLFLAAWIFASPAPAIDIVFDYRFDEGFFDAPERRDALERAARHYAARIDGALGTLPPTGWVAAFPHPSRAETVSLSDLDVPADAILIFVGARPMAEKQLLAVGGPGNLRLPCLEVLGPRPCDHSFADGALTGVGDWVLRFLFRERVAALIYPAQGFAPWGGSLSFGTDVDWYFGEDPEVPADRFDFLSSAVHELGHVLGIGTAESWGTRTPRGVFEGAETLRESAASIALHEDLSHWADGTAGRAEGGIRPAAFTRGLARGERKLLTELDVAALLDIGWSRLGDALATLQDPYGGQRLKGDVDGDGWVGPADAEALGRRLHRDRLLSGADLLAADVAPVHEAGFGDGVVDARDRDLLATAARWQQDPYGSVPGIVIECQEPLPPLVVRGADGLCLLLLRIPPGPEDLDAFALLGWEPPDAPEQPFPDVREGPPRKGDLDADGDLDEVDVELVEVLLASSLLDDERARDAADVAPMLAGNAMGDGRIDEADLALLEATLADPDIDGDGIATHVENELNQLWMAIVGRPRHGPLLRWTDDCLEPVGGQEGLPPIPTWMLFGAEIRFDFCSRNGSPWSLTPGISPEEYLADPARQSKGTIEASGSARGAAGVDVPGGSSGAGDSVPPHRVPREATREGVDRHTERFFSLELPIEPPPSLRSDLAADTPDSKGPRAIETQGSVPIAATAPAPVRPELPTAVAGSDAFAAGGSNPFAAGGSDALEDQAPWYERLLRWVLGGLSWLASRAARWLGIA